MTDSTPPEFDIPAVMEKVGIEDLVKKALYDLFDNGGDAEKHPLTLIVAIVDCEPWELPTGDITSTGSAAQTGLILTDHVQKPGWIRGPGDES